MNTTAEKMSTGARKRGLGFKIILLGILPVLLMAVINLGVSYRTGTLFENTLNTLNTKTDNLDGLRMDSINVRDSLTHLRDQFAALTSFHQKSILQRNHAATKTTREMRDAINPIFTELQQKVATLGKTVNSVHKVSNPADKEENDIRLRFLVRTANNLPRLFELFVESNEPSLKFLEKRRADQAGNNLIFEEASRQAVLQETLDHTADVLSELLFFIQTQSADERKTFKEDVTSQLSSTKYFTIATIAGVCVVLIIVALLFSSRVISKPLENMVGAMGRLSNGEVDVDIPQNQKDEIGAIAKALEIFKQNLIDTKKVAEERAQERARAAEEQRAQRNELANDFESKVGEVVNAVAASSTQLQSTARDMSTIASQNRERATNATSAATDATTNVQTVASAAEELSNSINEISRQVADSSNMASQAASQAENTNATMRELAEAAAKIGEVINLITDIAEQTNLLALNATIEAARAGEAGKGFAVVASEVKNLANQTAKATEEISHQVTTIQGTTNNAVGAIEEVSKMIDHMNEVSAAIAAAVEQQGAATQEISTNVASAAQSTQDASNDMGEVTQSAERNGQAADEVLHAAEALSSQSDSLRQQVDGFLEQVRAG